MYPQIDFWDLAFGFARDCSETTFAETMDDYEEHKMPQSQDRKLPIDILITIADQVSAEFPYWIERNKMKVY